MGIDHFARQAVGINGVAQLVGEAAAVFIHSQQVQLVLAFEHHGISVAEQEIVQEAQVEVGIVGQHQRVSLEHLGDVLGNPGLGKALFPQVLGGDAGELFNLGRHEAPGT